MTKPSVRICLFTYSQRPHLPVMNALIGALALFSERGICVTLSVRAGDGMLPRARNAAMSDFLNESPQCDQFIMIDDDNWCDAQGFLRLVEAPVDIVCAPCRLRSEPVTWPVRWATDRPIARDPNHGLVAVESSGTGIIRFSRRSVERMTEILADEWYADPTTKAGKAWPMFMYEIASRAWWGEDVAFCRRWRAAGGEIWVDPDIHTHHIGLMDFHGDIAEWLALMAPRINVVDKCSGGEVLVDNAFAANSAALPKEEIAA